MRLFRPHIPLSVRIEVATRQLAHVGKWRLAIACASGTGTMALRLDVLLVYLAGALGCPRDQLRLDHDPPLAARPQERRGLGKKTYYTPDANDPEHLFYRPHGAEFAGSHDVKTRLRGDHGQFSDIALIKRERRRARPPKPKKKWSSRPFPTGRKFK